jgi:hypothetical protein
VYQARVEVRGRNLEPRYRVSFLNELDRWIRGARNVLRNPARANDISVGAALLPVKASGGAWDLAVQLALDTGSIEFIPAPGGSAATGGANASWEAGALLVREGDDRDWEMLGVSGAHRATEGRLTRAGEPVVHEHRLTGVRPGRYRLAAFVKDRASSLYGSAQASFDLPPPADDALTEPVLLLSSKRYMIAPLPIFEKKSEGESRGTAAQDGAIPVPGREVRRGETLVVLSWLCRGRKVGAPDVKPTLRSYVSKDGAPIFRLEEPLVEPAGDCLRIADRLETAELEPGTYTYNLVYRKSPDALPVSRSRPFVIGAPPEGGPPGSTSPAAPTDTADPTRSSISAGPAVSASPADRARSSQPSGPADSDDTAVSTAPARSSPLTPEKLPSR